MRDLVHNTFGLDLRDGKERLVSTRLGKQIRAGGFRSFREYLRHVQDDRSGNSLAQLINALTTNHTSFLREPEHFRFLVNTVVPEWRDRRAITIWSAASSTGEEPYSILFSLLDAFRGGRIPDLRIIATDISTRVLSIASEGVYSADKLKLVPQCWPGAHFMPVGKANEYQVRADLRKLVEFRRFNLMDSVPQRNLYPLIFCRNVMIYFDKATQAGVVHRLSQALEPNGYLFVGHSESLTGMEHSLQYVCPAVYRKSR